MRSKIFHDLPKDAIEIRTEVFINEQGFQDEFDERDHHCTHILIYDDMQAIATCRVFYSEENASYMIGRIAVRKEQRGKKIGEMVVNEAEKYIRESDGKRVMLFAQKRAMGFYRKLGYQSNGYEGEEEGCPHVMMVKEW